MSIYFDNAATTPLSGEAKSAMIKAMENFGNPSSTHGEGRKAKAIIETVRKDIASRLNCKPSEIIFTCGGTEADNWALISGIKNCDVKHLYTSKIEHHAVTHVAEYIESNKLCEVHYIPHDNKGVHDFGWLTKEMESKTGENIMVSLMHANNEIGTLLPIKEVSKLCNQYENVYFHSDTVQTMGHYYIDVHQLGIDFLTCSAHKLHGPKGIGFLYINNNLSLNPLITGGSQERKQRGGTENIYGIIGLGKAMELAFSELKNHQEYIQGLKSKMMNQLKEIDKRISFNGEIEQEKSLYTVLNVCFPQDICNSMLLFSLDIHGIAASGGSACSSGSNVGSHVLAELPNQENCQCVRFSFSRFTTQEEIQYTLDKIKSIIKKS
jgi:cysteine desulfurase